MIFAKLVEQIAKDDSIDVISLDKAFEIQDVALLDNKHDSTKKHTLYFGYDVQLEHTLSIPSQCIIARTKHSIFCPPAVGNIALVSKDSLFTIFNDVKAWIETTRSKGIFELLTSLSDETHSIEAVIDAASVRLGNSLLFCDMNFKIIASSATIPVQDPLWIENIKQGYCSYEFISEAKKLRAVKNASNTNAAIEITCPQSAYHYLCSKVFHNQTQLGFLLMIEGESSILSSHFEMLSTISHVMSYTIAYYTPYLFEENSRYHELLYDMLIGTPSKNIIPRLKELPFPSKMLVLFIRPTRYLGQQYLTNFTYKVLKMRLPGTHTTYHNKGVVAVISLNENAETELSNILKDLCQKEHIQIGVSNSFTNMEYFVSFYKQAFAALELAQKLKTEELVCYYQDYQIFDLFSEIKSPDQLGRFCHPALAALRQYDYKNNSQLYKTLCVFIDNGCNIKLTSESLFIHRNSLVYRLNRINQIYQINFSDVNTLFLLRLSFLIERYNGLNTNIEWK